MAQERLTSPDQRLRALLEGEPLDRVPLFLYALGFCAKCVGYLLQDIYADATKSFFAQLRTAEMYGCQGLPRFGISIGALEFGGQVTLPVSKWAQAPSVSRFAVQSEEDIEKVQKLDVTRDGFLPMQMEVSKLNDRFGLPIIPFHNGSPFSRVANLCGTDNLCRWMLKKPEFMHRLLRVFTRHLVDVARYWVSTFGPERLLPFVATPVESNQVISPEQFKEFALPYLRELNEKMLSMGIKHIFCHFCGEQNSNLPYLTEVPLGNPGIASFGHEVDLTRAIEYMGNSCIIAGNVEPALIQVGTPEQVYAHCRECIFKAKRAPRGYLLAPGCEMPPAAPPYNVYMMKKAINDFGWYD